MRYPFASLAVAIALLTSGCGSAPKREEARGNEEDRKDKLQAELPTNLNVGPGKVIVTDTKSQEPQWNMEWQSAKVNVEEMESRGMAEAKQVKGEIIRDGAVVATYKAEAGLGDRAQQTLKLKGRVLVESKEHEATLSCEEMVYDAKLKVIKAGGGVKVTGDAGTIQTLEVWASPDLNIVATPDMFKQ